MPWCPACERFWSPSTVAADGSCPECGRVVDAGRARPAAPEQDEELPPLPWHFKALAGTIALYLGFRAFQGIEWLIQHL